MLNQRGGIEHDMTVIRLDDEAYWLSVGTGAVKRAMAWLYRHLHQTERVEIVDTTNDFATLALAGAHAPQAAEAAGAMDLLDLKYFRHANTEIAGVPVRAVRMSYVGEAGWEITCPADRAKSLYDTLAGAGARPAGMFAQTSMRIEKRFLAHGHDIDSDVDPLTAGLAFAVSWDTDFIGRDALKRIREIGQSKTIVTILFDNADAWPLGDEPVYADGRIVGQTTSAAFGYRIGKPIALAIVERTAAEAAVVVDIAGTHHRARSQPGAAFDPAGSRMRARSGSGG